ncbi:MAG: hypothetical protein KAS53_00330 [Candidatus Cloacimonetes bacterium]|nr:hypothetical protein [Candidatus Cloacimonadota bacterium]
MKSTLIILLIIFVFVSLLAEEPTLQEKMEVAKIDWDDVNFEFYISPVVMVDVGIGLTKSSKLKKVYHEGTLIIHADLLPNFLLPNLRMKDNEDFYKIHKWGLKYKSGYFSNEERRGFNWFFSLGFDAIIMDLQLDPGGSSGISNPDWYVFPDVAIGCGYSWRLNKGHYFRLSADIGLKILISNIYLSYVW